MSEEKKNEFNELIVKLYEKWLDEKDTEFPIEYLLEAQKVMPNAFRMTKVPFGFMYEEDDKVYFSFVKVSDGKLIVETEQIGYKKKD